MEAIIKIILFLILSLTYLYGSSSCSSGDLCLNRHLSESFSTEPAGIEDPSTQASIVQRFQDMIRVKTISYQDKSKIDVEAFEAFKHVLEKNYPNIHKTCTREFHGDSGILYHWKGRTGGDPVVLMSHYDVVPVNEELWTKPPFDAILENGVIWEEGL